MTLGSKTRVSLSIAEQASLITGAVLLAVGGYASYVNLRQDIRDARTDLGARIERLEQRDHIGRDSGSRPTLADHVADQPDPSNRFPKD